MILYHGTARKNLDDIRKKGLLPRHITKKPPTMKHDETPDTMVFLTVGYAPHYAACAAGEKDDWLIVEIDGDRLNKANLFPDEHYLEQVTRDAQNVYMNPILQRLATRSVSERIRYFQKNLHHFKEMAPQSLNAIGNIQHKGVIPPGCIQKMARFRPEENEKVTRFSIEPPITVLNFQLARIRYMALHKWFIDGTQGAFAFEPNGRYVVYDRRAPEIKVVNSVQDNPPPDKTTGGGPIIVKG